jgi:uncharacterized membrane protein YhaH (DUF805 family)
MESHASFFCASGRIAPKPFIVGASVVYVASFLSQFLLASPITQQANVIPFVAVQVIVAWAWYVLHVRRLRDAGRATGSALALTIIYALSIVLLLLVMAAANAMSPPESSELRAAGVTGIFLVVFLAWLVIGNSALGMFGYVLLGALVLITLPVLIAIVYTIWLAGRPSVPAAP